MKRGRRPAYEEEADEEDGSEQQQGYSNAESEEDEAEYTQQPSVKREPGSSRRSAGSSRKMQRSQQRTQSQRASQGCATPHTQQQGTANGAAAGPGPSSERQEQRRQLQQQQQRAQPQPGDVQKLNAKITKYKQEETARKEEAALPLDDMELALLAGNVVRYMLFSHYEKPSVPVSRTKLNEAILVQYNDHPRKRKIPPVVMAIAQRRMLSVFGIELMEVERTSDKKDDGGNKFYVLRSALPPQVREAYVPCPLGDKGPDQGLLTLVLAFILMQGGKLKEEDLWDSLEKLGIQKEQTHPHFGKVREAVQKLEATRYIIRRKLPTAPGSQASFCYEWGECAHGEIEPEHVKSFVDGLFAKREQRRQQDA